MVDGTCPTCGYSNPLGSNFCSSCGGQISRRGSDDTRALDPTADVSAVPPEPDSGDSTALLVVRQGAKRGMRIALDSECVQLGRHPESDIFLDDITVSRRHAELRRTETGHEVVDVGSLNGTYVNLDRVDRAELADGDELRVGKFKLVYVAAEGGA